MIGVCGEKNTINTLIDFSTSPPGQTLILPSLISDYRFVSIGILKSTISATGQNPHNITLKNFSNIIPISKGLYKKLEDFENDDLKGAFYDDNNGGVWLNADLKFSQYQLSENFQGDLQLRNVESEQANLETIFAHAKTINEIKDMLDILGKLNPVEYENLPDSYVYFYPKLQKKEPNQIVKVKDYEGNEQKYKMYIPPNYDFAGRKWSNSRGVSICLNELTNDKDECRSPGGACTNAWGTNADYVIHTPNNGRLISITSIPICTDREAEYVLWKHQNPGITGCHFIAKDPKDYKEVLNLFYMAESVVKISE